MTWVDTTLVFLVLFFLAVIIWRQVTKKTLSEMVREVKEAISEVKE